MLVHCMLVHRQTIDWDGMQLAAGGCLPLPLPLPLALCLCPRARAVGALEGGLGPGREAGGALRDCGVRARRDQLEAEVEVQVQVHRMQVQDR